MLGCIFLSVVLSFLGLSAAEDQSKQGEIQYFYYSPENLERLNKINQDLSMLKKDVAQDIKELQADESVSKDEKEKILLETGNREKIALRKKHIPLLILSDPEDSEGASFERQSAALQITLHSVASASFKPLILLNSSILENVSRNKKELVGFNDLETEYSFYFIKDNQFLLLLPAWFKAHYKISDFFNEMQGVSISDYLSNYATPYRGKNPQWLKEKRSKNKGSFIQDMSAFFKPEGKPLAIYDIFIIGHGAVEKRIAGLDNEDFLALIRFFSSNITTGTLNILSCFVGGKNAHWLNEAIEKENIEYSVILSGIGETTYKGATVKDSEINKRFNENVRYFFNDAAYVDETKESFDHLLHGLLLHGLYREGSLHSSEYLPAFKLKGSKRFVPLENVPGYYVIGERNNFSEVVPKGTHTIIFVVDKMRELRIWPIAFNQTRASEGIKKMLQKLYPEEYKIPKYIMPSLLPFVASDKIEINKIYLFSEVPKTEFKVGIYSFFASFLASKIKYPEIKIKELDGFFDLEQTILTEEEVIQKEQKHIEKYPEYLETIKDVFKIKGLSKLLQDQVDDFGRIKLLNLSIIKNKDDNLNIEFQDNPKKYSTSFSPENRSTNSSYWKLRERRYF